MKDTLKVGVATADITPDGPCELSGFAARVQPSTGVHDPAWARAVVFEGGGRRAALLACDLLGFQPETDTRIRARLCETANLDGVLLSCTHTHSGPASMRLHGCGSLEEAWLETLVSQLVEVTRRAASDTQPVRAEMARTEIRVGLNRRVPTERGILHLSRRGDRPPQAEAGVYDPDLTALRFVNPEGQGVATLLNHACHPVSLGSEWRTVSCDFPGVAVRSLESTREGGGFGTAIYVQGACGDINPDVERRGWPDCERIGREIGEASRIGFRENRRELALTPPDYAEKEQFLPFRDHNCVIMNEVRDHPAEGSAAGIRATISALSLGEVAFVTLPGEAFCAQGLEIRQRSPFPCTVIAAYSNGNMGYLPTREAYPLGGYEVNDAHRYYGYPDCVAPEAGELCVETAVELLDLLKERKRD